MAAGAIGGTAVDVNVLTAPLSDEDGARAGPDMSYDDARVAIEAPFQLDAGGEAVEERAWRDAIRGINAQVEQTRDLWLAVYLARAGAKVGDLQVVADGAELLAGLLEDLWDEVHPTLEEADFVGRRTPCDSLTKIREFLAPLRRATLWEHRVGRFSGEDLERFASEGESAEGYAQFRGAMASTDPTEVKEVFATAAARLDAIKAALKRTDAVLVARAGSETGTNFTTTYETLNALHKAVVPFAGLTPEPTPEAAASEGGGGMPSGPGLSGRVNSRDDVTKAIDAIIDYYKVREPASPVATLMRRARHWVSMDFLELIEELLPDSATAARQLLVSKKDAPEESGYGY
ncbi:ImpA family type VI secretion system protein [Sphingomonas bacterium]|uniref:type VI secretion system protein TssA n=1 Tax=Sphingomonas bacterium TaxID=1895847 RepID=UPI0015750D6C|nr:type VI secretion system ImpA family N-terminal domain-containing protein [Sphingomonas bacterium]